MLSIKNSADRFRNLLIFCLIFSSLISCSNDDDDESDDPQLRIENFNIGATSTFLRADDSDNPSNPLIINLNDIGISNGDLIKLRTIGNFINSPTGNTRDDAIGVFSSSTLLLDKSELNRIVDAIDAGEDRITDNTFEQNQITDISQDFRIDENLIEIVVPTGALFLFIGNADSKQSDNSDSPSDFKLELTY